MLQQRWPSSIQEGKNAKKPSRYILGGSGMLRIKLVYRSALPHRFMRARSLQDVSHFSV
jgi:hypothetical protein